MALIAEGAGHTYAAGTAFARRGLARVDLTVGPGELAVVVGATGSGKSTLLRLLAGLLPPTEGRVILDGDDLAARATEVRGRIGMVFQDPESQFFSESVLADVAFGPRNLGAGQDAAAAAAEEALASVGLDPAAFGPRSPFTLSGGEARRAAIAGVLAMRPAYLLLDEPTAGLDHRGRSAVLAAIEAMRATAGVVVVTHDAEEFLGGADHLLVLAEGEPAFAGPARALLDDPAALERAGLAIPEVVRVQVLARERGAVLAELTLDPRLAAERLMAASVGSR